MKEINHVISLLMSICLAPNFVIKWCTFWSSILHKVSHTEQPSPWRTRHKETNGNKWIYFLLERKLRRGEGCSTQNENGQLHVHKRWALKQHFLLSLHLPIISGIIKLVLHSSSVYHRLPIFLALFYHSLAQSQLQALQVQGNHCCNFTHRAEW